MFLAIRTKFQFQELKNVFKITFYAFRSSLPEQKLFKKNNEQLSETMYNLNGIALYCNT